MIAHTNSLIKKKTSNSRFNKNLPNPLLKNLSPKKGFGDTDQKLLRWVGNYYCSQLFLLPILTLRTTLQNAGKHKGSMSTAHELHVIVFIMSGHGDHLHIMAVRGINDRILPLVSDAKIFAPEGKAAILALGHSSSLVLRRWSSSRAMLTSCPISSAAFMPIFSTCASASREDTSGFSPVPSAWRLAISPRIAATMNPALLSPSCLTDSIPSMTSWGTRMVVICDFAFLYTDIVNHQFVMCISLYIKVRYKNTCNVYHQNIFYISHGDACISHNMGITKTAKPASATNTYGFLTTNR